MRGDERIPAPIPNVASMPSPSLNNKLHPEQQAPPPSTAPSTTIPKPSAARDETRWNENQPGPPDPCMTKLLHKSNGDGDDVVVGERLYGETGTPPPPPDEREPPPLLHPPPPSWVAPPPLQGGGDPSIEEICIMLRIHPFFPSNSKIHCGFSKQQITANSSSLYCNMQSKEIDPYKKCRHLYRMLIIWRENACAMGVYSCHKIQDGKDCPEAPPNVELIHMVP